MTINVPCWTTSKEEADQLVDELYNDAVSAGKVSVDVKTSTDNNKRE